MKMYRGSGDTAPRPSYFITGERALGTPWIGGWVGSRAGLDAVTKRISPIIVPSWNRTPVVQPIF